MAFSKPAFCLGKALLGGAGLLFGAAAAGFMLSQRQEPIRYRRGIIELEPTELGEEREQERTNEIFSGERQAEVLTVQSNSSAYDSHGNTEARAEHQHHQTDENNLDCGQREESGDQEAGGSNEGGTGGDAGGQGSDNDEEDSFSDEDSSSDEDNSSDEEDSTSYDISDSTCQPSISDLVESLSDFSSDSTLQLNISEDKILIGHFNSNSINKKQSRISKLINKFNLKVVSLNETRVTLENGDQRLGEIKPGEFQVCHQPRVNQDGKSKKHTGGGVAILSSKELQEKRIRYEDTSFKSFEYVAVDLHHVKWDRHMQTINLYRPPGGKDEDMRKFREEFQSLLKTFPENDSILITGDFNIWVNDENNKHAKWFKTLLRDNGFRQHVREPTHNRGNTLDLVITRNVNISTLRVKKPKNRNQLSDHYAVIFGASPASEITLKRKCTESPGTASKKFKDNQK